MAEKRKKGFLSIFIAALAVVALLGLLVGLSSDKGEEKEVESHTHTVAVVDGTPSTCTNAGKTSGQVCRDCGKVLIAQKETPISAAHNYGDDGVCVDCGNIHPFISKGYAEQILTKVTNSSVVLMYDTTESPAAKFGVGEWVKLTSVNVGKVSFIDVGDVNISNGFTFTDSTGQSHTVYLWIRVDTE